VRLQLSKLLGVVLRKTQDNWQKIVFLPVLNVAVIFFLLTLTPKVYYDGTEHFQIPPASRNKQFIAGGGYGILTDRLLSEMLLCINTLGIQ
jgi:hypothetical protein